MHAPPYKILYLNHVAEAGGAETGLFDIVTHLDRQAFRPLVVLPTDGTLAKRLAQRGVDVRFLPLQRHKKTLNPLQWLAAYGQVTGAARQLATLIRREHIDLIHSNSTTAHIYGVWAGKLTGVPVVWHCRDLVTLGALGRFLYRRTARVIAISRTVQATFRRYADGGAKVICIHNGLDLEPFRQADGGLRIRQELGLVRDQKLIGMVAQMVPWKNHGLFLRAASRIAAEFPEAIFVLAGADIYGDHPAYRPALERRADKLELQGRVRFLGYRQDVPALMNALDLLVHPAAGEPFGRAVAEAMAAGKPVVAIDNAGPREIIEAGVSGLLIPPDDVEALVQAMRRMLSDSALAARLGAAARQRIEDCFRLDAMLTQIEQLYRQVLESR